eukprot:SRR837773.21282.p1 GENE.SRR837773.21282~~SRR837773.21282.p1  ORF type:complete len:348 (-),score=89.60 SRR837773.21282:25-1068(-)
MSAITLATPWVVLPGYVETEIAEVVQTTAESTAANFMIASFLATLIITWNAGLALGVMVTLAVSLGVLGMIVVSLADRRTAGVMDIVVMAAYLSMLLTQLVRVAQQYSFGQEEPCSNESFELKSVVGPSSGSAPGVPKPISQQLWEGAVASERRIRAAGALFRSTDAVLGSTISSLLVGAVFMSTAMESLGQVSMGVMCACLFAIPVVLGLCPILFGMGLGPSRVQWRALCILVSYIRRKRERRRRAEKSRYGMDAEVEYLTAEAKEAMRAAQVLGWPFVRCVPGVPSSHGKHRKRKRLFGRGQNMGHDIGDEDDGPHVMSLHIHGATATPPFHFTTAVREKVGSDG